MLGIGMSELIIIGLMALIFIGPKDLPQVAAKIARFLNELKRGADSFKREITLTSYRPRADEPPPKKNPEPDAPSTETTTPQNHKVPKE